MLTVISSATGLAYRRIAKPILFTRKPDDVHNRMLASGRRVQHVRPITWLLHASWAYENPPVLGQTLHGIPFDNPVGLSAGFDKNFQLPLLLKAVGFGFMEGGSVTLRACDGNPRPWFYRLPKSKSLVVHAGLANQGVKVIVERIQGFPPNTFNHFPLNISVAKTNSREASGEQEAITDYVGSLQTIKQTGVGRLITLNISCPNTFGGEPFTTPGRLEKLLSSIDAVGLSQPIFIKMPVNLPWEDFRQLLEVSVKHNIAGVTISNLTKDRRNLRDSLPDSIRGGLSGKPTFELSNQLIAKTYRHYGKRLTIIGVGGIFSAEDAYIKIKLGASLVELITGMVFEGPQLIGQINRGLAKRIQKDGFNNIAEAVGSGNWLIN